MRQVARSQKQLPSKDTEQSLSSPIGEFVYSGNLHQSVPRTLFLDKRLTPLERNAWQVIHMLMNHEHPRLTAAYKQLQPYLASMPCVKEASTETVAKTLTILRLSRWMTLAYRKRAKNGCVQGNLYLLHEEPLSISENIQLDAEYFSLVCQSLNHANKAVRTVAVKILEEITEDADLAGRRLPTKIERVLTRVEQNLMQADLSTSHASEGSQGSLLRNDHNQVSNSEVSVKPAPDHCLPNPKSDVRNVCINNKNTIQRGNDLKHPLLVPQVFYHLSQNRQKQVLSSMRHLNLDMQQKVLDEWAKRAQWSSVRKPAAYLFGMIQRAYRGELNAFCEEESPVGVEPEKSPGESTVAKNKPAQSSPVQSEEEKALQEQAIQKLRELANRLRRRS